MSHFIVLNIVNNNYLNIKQVFVNQYFLSLGMMPCHDIEVSPDFFTILHN